MQLHQSDLDFKKATERAVAGFENALKESGDGVDKDLLTAIDILRNYEPSIASAGPDLNEFTDLEREIIGAWNLLFDEHIRAHAQPRSLRDATLLVDVDNSAWLGEILRYHKKEILARIQERFGKQVVRKIYYRENDLPSNEVRVSFLIPEPLIRLSATPQLPCSLKLKLSAQDLIRAALVSAGATNRILVSFHPAGSFPGSAILKEPRQESASRILSVSESAKFAVFGEDDFRCQRCGRKAPEVLLCLGEVKRFAVGDRSYVTICVECDRAIRPPTTSIQEAIAEETEIKMRQEQSEFMSEFQGLSECWSTLVPNYSLSGGQKCLLCGLISQFEADEIETGMRIAVNAYVESVDGTPTNHSVAFALRRVGGICHNTRLRKAEGTRHS